MSGDVNIFKKAKLFLFCRDLSNNNLNGEVPDFLSELQYLKIL